MKRIRLVVLTVLIVLFAVALMASLVGCADDDGEVGNIIDRTLWDMRGYPTQQEILDHLRDKYGQEFTIVSLNSGARFFQGTVHPTDNPDLLFNLELHDDDGNPVGIEDMRDDFQARLVEQYIDEQVRPIIISEIGLGNVETFRVDVAIFDRIDTGTLPAYLEWTLDDGLVALAENDDISVQVTFRITLENEAVLNAFGSSDLGTLAQSVLYDGEVPFDVNLILRTEDSRAGDVREFHWLVEGDITVAGDGVLW